MSDQDIANAESPDIGPVDPVSNPTMGGMIAGLLEAKLKEKDDTIESLQQQVDKLKQDALEDAEWAEACDVRNDTLQQQVDALTAEVEGFSRVYGATSRSLIKAAAQEKDNAQS
jgi:FtsZ-binding cell division protein ZapB